MHEEGGYVAVSASDTTKKYEKYKCTEEEVTLQEKEFR